jgi:hypothetical protein
MIYISHRGYTNGIDHDLENNPQIIERLLDKNINVEIDVRFFNNQLYLGHDEPRYKIDNEFLSNDKLWCHAKDFHALEVLSNIDCNYFWHQNDDYTITSKGYIWVYPGKPLLANSICVLPEEFNQDFSMCYGMCTDYINKYIKF